MFTRYQFLLRVAMERINWVPIGLKHKHSEATAPEIYQSYLESRETEGYVSKVLHAGVSKQQ
jgi:hypothetical protein